MFGKKLRQRVYEGDSHWQQIQIPGWQTYDWNDAFQTYIKKSPFFD